MQIYYGIFESIEDVSKEFYINQSELDLIEIVYAQYDCENYEGYAHLIFIKDGLLFEVNGSHCSCNGLEGQWYPEETTLNALLARPNVSIDAKNNLKERFKNLILFI